MVLLHKLIAAGEALGVFSVALITAVVVYDVLARAAGYPTLWALEVSGYLMVAASVLAAGEVMRKGGHFEVRLFLDMLPQALRSAIDWVVALVTAVFAACVTVGCVQLVIQTHTLGFKSPTLLQVPLAVPQSVLLLGLTLLTVAALLRVIAQWREDPNANDGESAS
jgi:TRAP-type C4-dicarboxylate transport system permease small subunit